MKINGQTSHKMEHFLTGFPCEMIFFISFFEGLKRSFLGHPTGNKREKFQIFVTYF